MCCDSPWVTTISCFIHNVAFPWLINACLPINDPHKTPSRLWLIWSHGHNKRKKKKKKKTDILSNFILTHRKHEGLPMKFQSNCQTNKCMMCLRSQPHYCTTTGLQDQSWFCFFGISFSSPGIGKYRPPREVCCY